MSPVAAAPGVVPAASAVSSIDAAVLLPVLAPALGAVLLLLVDLAAPRLRRVHYGLALAIIALGGLGTVPGLSAAPGDARTTLCLPGSPSQCLYSADAVTSGLQLAALAAAFVVVLLSWPEQRTAPQGRTAVACTLLLAATAGATAIAGARDLGSWLVALELATLPVVALVALRGLARAVDGAVSLLITSLVSFAFLALAAALWFTATGSAFLDTDAALAAAGTPATHAILVLAVVLFVAGVGFKLSLVPFHAWTPEAYVGAPVPIAAFLAATSKVAALAALLVVVRAVTVLGAPALTAIAIVAALSMTLGNVMALRQDDVVRLLAWSTVAQAGWVVMPLAVVSPLAVTASSGYLLAYVLATVLAFAVVAALAHVWGLARARQLTAYRGLLRGHPLLGVSLGLALLSLAGLPPGVLGLVAKIVALRPVMHGQLWALAVVAAVNAVIGVAVYLRWLRAALERPQAIPVSEAGGASDAAGDGSREGETETTRVHWRSWHPAQLVAVAVGFIALVATSLAPQLVLGLLGP
ncbi:proton-conducting transporter transmembrane domain-containing protein [Segeticoccus rhizosphaerae]|uniref:proton-conducting transporter transmembrane domain-containing protein n=2 Tax=Segeticoccus rhizosphaerae TaxID=1104777 RepID=UPI001EE3C395|nr:proton-conducting transporter membrane subunit [Ornithinicoccus soli]